MPRARAVPARYRERGFVVRLTYLQCRRIEDAQNNLVTTLKTFMDKVGGAINQVATLEVRTFVSDEIEGIKLENGQLVGDMRLARIDQHRAGWRH